MNDDWFRKYLEQIKKYEKLLEPQRRLQEQMDKWLEPQRRLQEQMDKLLEPQRRLQEQMDKLLEPQRRLQEQMDKWLEPQRRLQEQMEKWLEPQRRLQEQLDKWLEPQHRLQEQMRKWLEPKRTFQENLKKWEQSFKVEEFITEILSKAEQENIVVNQDGTISVEGEVFSASEFSEVYCHLLDSIKNIASPTQVLSFIGSYAQKLKKPIATLLLIVILPFLINITSNISTSYFENIINKLSNKPKIEKIEAIKQEAQQDFSPEFLQNYRFVTANTLNVRGGPSTKNSVIDEIYFGQVAKLVQKGRKWSAIEYTDEDTGEAITGWVFNRYLGKFKK